MNLERHIQRLNQLLRQELGSQQLYSWQQAHALRMPAIRVDQYGEHQMEYVCQCGVDVLVHRSNCRSIIAARKKVELVRILPGEEWAGRWVICALFHPDLYEWQAAFGTHVNFPYGGVWQPIAVGSGTIKTRQGQTPTLDDTQTVINIIRTGREVSAKEAVEAEMAAADAHERKHHQHIMERVADIAQPTLNLLPGKKANASYPGVQYPA